MLYARVDYGKMLLAWCYRVTEIKKDLQPDMTVEMRRAGKTAVSYKRSSEGCSWKVTTEMGRWPLKTLGTQLQSPED